MAVIDRIAQATGLRYGRFTGLLLVDLYVCDVLVSFSFSIASLRAIRASTKYCILPLRNRGRRLFIGSNPGLRIVTKTRYSVIEADSVPLSWVPVQNSERVLRHPDL